MPRLDTFLMSTIQSFTNKPGVTATRNYQAGYNPTNETPKTSGFIQNIKS